MAMATGTHVEHSATLALRLVLLLHAFLTLWLFVETVANYKLKALAIQLRHTHMARRTF